MQVFSIYETMQQSASLCPDKSNIKLLIRHSLREPIVSNADIIKASLIREGEIMAYRLGKSLDIKIGCVSTSGTPRCIDTCKKIIAGYNISHDKKCTTVIQRSLAMQMPQNKDMAEAGKTFKEWGCEKIYFAFADGITPPGLYDLKTSACRVLDYIFGNGNQENTLDLFCTQYFQLAMLLLFLFGRSNDIYGDDGWPLMLEGMFLWGKREKFTVAWRGEKHEVQF